jgi:two-component system response regulator PilR (NtrC family)
MKKTCRILVVDDEQDILDLFANYLSSQNYSVTTARDGLDALQQFDRGKFDMVISDMMMPNMDGMILLEEVRKIDKDIIFLLVTSFPSIETAVSAIRKGAYDYITKPFNLEDVKFKIERAIERKSLQEQVKNVRGIMWALLFSIPLWLIIGIIVAWLLR